MYESLSEVGSMHFAAVNDVIKKLVEIILLFFITTDFYGKWTDINWEKKLKLMDRALGIL